MENNEKAVKCVNVRFENGWNVYTYKCPFEYVDPGDIVQVLINTPDGRKVEKATVVSINYYTKATSPYPLEKMKKINGIVGNVNGFKDLNSKEILIKISKIKTLEKEIEKYCLEKFNIDIRMPMMGNCHVYWGAKKKILKEKYNIDWLTPSECNPYIIFD